MRVLVVGEGPHELGDGRETSSLVSLLQRLLPQRSIEATCCAIKSFKQRVHGRGDRHVKKLLWILNDAAKSDYEAVVLLIDRDGDKSRQSAIDIAQVSDFVNIPRAFGVAVESYDAWFLADHAKLAELLDIRIDMISQPEKKSDPKSLLRNYKNQSAYEGTQRQLYFDLAEIVDLELLKQRCPGGFGEFSERVLQLLLQLP
ncbi:MAG: hypothetical protein R3C18_23945 [Planctomycetaceae bacterium]